MQVHLGEFQETSYHDLSTAMVSSMEEFFGSNSKKHGTDQAGYDPFTYIRLIMMV